MLGFLAGDDAGSSSGVSGFLRLIKWEISVGFGRDDSPADAEGPDGSAVSPFKNLASNILTSSVDCE